jgi:SAM-dependent methyltransferase
MEPTEENIRAWERAHRRRPQAPGHGLPPLVRRTLGELQGKRVLHVGCEDGTATAELAELGAVATGVDDDPDLLEAARQRAPSVLWVEADPAALPAELRRGRFDLLYAGEGLLARIPDLDPFAVSLAATLRPDGELLLHDEHPVAGCIDQLLHWRGDYFGEETHRLGRIVSALARAGFGVEALEEFPPEASRHRFPDTFLLYARRRD